MASVGAHIAQLGWAWTETHVIICVDYDGKRYRVAVPIARLQNEASKELRAIGCPLAPSVGGVVTVGGFWGSIKRAVRKVKRSVRRAVPKALRRAANRVTRFASRAAKTVRHAARSVVRSKALKTALFAASFIPGAAAITAPSLAAIQIADTIDRRIADGEAAARQIARGVRSLDLTQKKGAGLASMAQVKNLRQLAKKTPAAANILGALAKKYR